MAALPHPFTEIDVTKLPEESNWTKSLKILEAHHQQQNSLHPTPFLYGASRTTKSFVVEDFPCDFPIQKFGMIRVEAKDLMPLLPESPAPAMDYRKLPTAHQMRHITIQKERRAVRSLAESLQEVTQKIHSAALEEKFECEVEIPSRQFWYIYRFLRRRHYVIFVNGSNDKLDAQQILTLHISWNPQYMQNLILSMMYHIWGIWNAGIPIPWRRRENV